MVASVSTLSDFEGVEPESDVALVGGGGGSITEATGDAFDNGSGSKGSGSSEDEVSIVICFVDGGV